MLTDPISDMLTRIRNGGAARLRQVDMPQSRMKIEIAKLLASRGYIAGYANEEDAKRPTLTIELRYNRNLPMIEGIQRVSRPGRRVYVSTSDIPKIRNGLGMAILSTPRGILTDDQAREARVGGEVLAEVW